jgi:hypothetical protein
VVVSESARFAPADVAQALGLLHRMLASLNGPVVLERAAPFGDPARLFAVTGPEFG